MSSGFRWKHLFRYSLENSFSRWMLYTLSAMEGTSLRQISAKKGQSPLIVALIKCYRIYAGFIGLFIYISYISSYSSSI